MGKIERDRTLEADISFAVAKVLEDYENKTGLVATNINVIVTNKMMGVKNKLDWTISDVRVDLRDPRDNNG